MLFFSFESFSENAVIVLNFTITAWNEQDGFEIPSRGVGDDGQRPDERADRNARLTLIAAGLISEIIIDGFMSGLPVLFVQHAEPVSFLQQQFPGV